MGKGRARSRGGLAPGPFATVKLLRHDKLRITVQRSRGSDHRNFARGRARWNRRRDLGIGNDFEGRGLAVELHADRSSQVVAEDDDLLPDFAGHRHGFHQRARAIVDAENRPVAARACAVICGSIEKSIGGLKKAPNRIVAFVSTLE